MEEIVTVKWKGPYRLNDVSLLGDDTNQCIYAITRIWGDKDEQLQYIGRTKRELRQRIHEHSWWLSESRGIYIRYGKIELAPGQKWSTKRFYDVEALLIATLLPPENTSNSRFYNGRDGLTIKNCGRRGPIAQYVSSSDLIWV